MDRNRWVIVIFILIVLVFVYWCMTMDVYASEPTVEPTEEPTPEPTIEPTPSLTPDSSASPAPSEKPSTAPDDDPEPIDIPDYTAVLEEIRDTQYYMLFAMVAILAVLLITIFVTGIDRR